MIRPGHSQSRSELRIEIICYIILTVRLAEWGYKRINTVGSEGVN